MLPYLEWYEQLLSIVFVVDEPVSDEHPISEEEDVISQYSGVYYFILSYLIKETPQRRVYLLSVVSFCHCIQTWRSTIKNLQLLLLMTIQTYK